MRAWIEAGFKEVKRGGWGWHQSKMQDARRVERLWLAYAGALVWTVAVGSQAEQTLPSANVASLPPTHIARQRHQHSDVPCVRRLSCPPRGRMVRLSAVLRSEVFPLGAILVAQWPEMPAAPHKGLSTTKQRRRQKRREHKRRNKAAKRRASA